MADASSKKRLVLSTNYCHDDIIIGAMEMLSEVVADNLSRVVALCNVSWCSSVRGGLL